MELKIGNKNYTLKYGMDFIASMDKIYYTDMNGVEFGMGLEMMSSYLEMERPTALMNVIRAGTSHLDSVPSKVDIESYLEEVYIEGTEEEMFKKVKVETEQAPFLKKHMKALNKAGAEAQAKAEKKPVKKPTKE